MVVKKARRLTYTYRCLRNTGDGGWDSTGTQLVSQAGQAVSQPRTRPTGPRSLVASWLQHHHDPTHQPSLAQPLRSPPFPPFLSPPSLHNFTSHFSFPFPRPLLLYLPVIWYVLTRALQLRRPSRPCACLLLWLSTEWTIPHAS